MNQVYWLLEQYFPPDLQQSILQYKDTFSSLKEIRCRCNQPLFLTYSSQKEQVAYDCITKQHIQYLMSRMSQGSIYAWEEEFRSGYFTLPGGFRVGIVGKGVLEHGRIRTLKEISCLNFRIVRAIYGAADLLMPWVYQRGKVLNCLIVSPPGGGKTSLLRDLIRQLSNGIPSLALPGCTVGVVDERSELAGSVAGIAQLDVGCRTDLLDGCPKGEGIRMLLRAMAPQVIAVDEIGTEEDAYALEAATQSGVAIMATAHGDSMESLQQHPVMRKLIQRHYFQRIVFLHWQKEQIRMELFCANGGTSGAYEYQTIGCNTDCNRRERNGVL